jgi:hypothetical protein
MALRFYGQKQCQRHVLSPTLASLLKQSTRGGLGWLYLAFKDKKYTIFLLGLFFEAKDKKQSKMHRNFLSLSWLLGPF